MGPERKLHHVDPRAPRGLLYHAICRFSVTRAGSWLAVKIAWKLDPRMLRLTRGRLSSAWPVRAALLETVGARTARRRRTATLYFHDGDRVILVAALRGSPRNPAWYHNLREHPGVVFGGLPFRAEAVDDERERERLWGLAERIYPPYADFRHDARKAGSRPCRCSPPALRAHSPSVHHVTSAFRANQKSGAPPPWPGDFEAKERSVQPPARTSR